MTLPHPFPGHRFCQEKRCQEKSCQNNTQPIGCLHSGGSLAYQRLCRRVVRLAAAAVAIAVSAPSVAQPDQDPRRYESRALAESYWVEIPAEPSRPRQPSVVAVVQGDVQPMVVVVPAEQHVVRLSREELIYREINRRYNHHD